MSFLRSSGEPQLTKLARKLSDAVEGLDATGQDAAIKTISSLVEGIRSLGKMPDAVCDLLWDCLLVIGRKALMGQKPEKLFVELETGLSPRLRGMIEREAFGRSRSINNGKG